VGGREYDWLVTVLSNKTLLYFVGVAQEAEFDVYAQVFQAMIDSVQLAR
jgi:hypothetical protein